MNSNVHKSKKNSRLHHLTESPWLLLWVVLRKLSNQKHSQEASISDAYKHFSLPFRFKDPCIVPKKERTTINFSAPVILYAGWYSPFYIGNATDVFSFYLLELCLKLLPLTENNENAVRGQPNIEWTAINQQKRFLIAKFDKFPKPWDVQRWP